MTLPCGERRYRRNSCDRGSRVDRRRGTTFPSRARLRRVDVTWKFQAVATRWPILVNLNGTSEQTCPKALGYIFFFLEKYRPTITQVARQGDWTSRDGKKEREKDVFLRPRKIRRVFLCTGINRLEGLALNSEIFVDRERASLSHTCWS